MTFTRWRLSSAAGLQETGNATDGEVEDHTVMIEYPKDYGGWFREHSRPT